MGGGAIDFTELRERVEARAEATRPQEIFKQEVVHQQMVTRGLTVRECVANDEHPDPLPITIALDLTGSMEHLPDQLARHALLGMLNRMTQMASAGTRTPEICYLGVTDTADRDPLQVGQFEADNRIDNWLTRLHLNGGGAGSDTMHEAYTLVLYFLARKTACDIWKKGGKGIALIAGDEMCPSTLSRQVVREVFGDTIPHDLTTADLLREVREKWELFFLYVETGYYQKYGYAGSAEKIFQAWERLLDNHVIRLDGQATGLPEIVSALIGTTLGTFPTQEVPQRLRNLGCEEPIVAAVAKALNVKTDTAPKDEPTSHERRTARRRGLTKL